MKTMMRIENRKLSELNPAEYNPRVQLAPGDKEYEDLKRSLDKWGCVEPIVINSDGTIIGGHQRYRVLLDLGYEETEVSVVDLSKDDEKALNIALNKIDGQWDEIKLRDLLLDLDLNEYDLDATGFSSQEIEDLVISLEKDADPVEDNFDPDAALEEIQEPVTKKGDLWILGRHRLLCGDSTLPEDVAKLMGGEEMDLVITDPPYNVNYGDKAEMLNKYMTGNELVGHRNTNHIANDSMDDISFYYFLLAMYQNAFASMRPGAAIYVFHAESSGVQFRQAFTDAGLKLTQCLIWEKNTFVLGRQDYQWRHEPCLYGWKEGAAHYFINDRTQDTVLLDEEIDLESMKKQDLITYIQQIQEAYREKTTILYENKPMKADLHPTMKPIPLIGRLMKNSSKSGWNVADFFGGSGTTLMAAEQLNRCAFLMEYDEKFCDVIIRRWEEYTGEKAVLYTGTELEIEL